MSVKITNGKVISEAREEVLSIIDRICSENGLKYFAFSNLLVGAVHYGDFLPGGTGKKIEIGLLRADYERLYKILSDKSGKLGLTILDRYTSGAKKLRFTVRKTVSESTASIEVSVDIDLEVNPFDFVPDSKAQQKVFFRKVFFAARKYKKIVNLVPKSAITPIKIKEAASLFWGTLRYGHTSPKKSYDKLYSMLTSEKNTKFIRRLVPEFGVLLPIEDVFPTKRMKLGNIEIECPNNYYHWTAVVDEELMTRTKTIQQIDLVILKEFDRVCREIGVGYFVCGGTMLGVLRHGGFIPWDDDADCGMLREDYNKFLKEAPKYLSKDFFLQTRKSDPKIPYLFSKIRMNETEYITNYNELRDFHKGICLDIFPFDYVPNNLNARFQFVRDVKTAERLHNIITNKQLEKPVYDGPAKDSKERSARFVNEVRRLLVHLVPLSFTQWIYIKRATKYNKKAKQMGLKTVASFVPTYTYADVEDMKPYQDINFEGVQAMGLKDMDKFLKMQYGDYMQLPAPHQRVGHDLIRWSISDKMAEKYNIK